MIFNKIFLAQKHHIFIFISLVATRQWKLNKIASNKLIKAWAKVTFPKITEFYSFLKKKKIRK